MKEGKFHGLGTYLWPDGRKYVGFYKDGKPNSWGTYTDPSTAVHHMGEWKNGVADGYGLRFSLPDGPLYYGGWKGGKMHGQGTYVKMEGQTNGEFRDDKPWNAIACDNNGNVIGSYSEGILTKADGSKKQSLDDSGDK
jgi:hypothetical protein